MSGEFSQEGGKENHYIIILYLLNHCVLKVLVCMHDTTIHVRVHCIPFARNKMCIGMCNVHGTGDIQRL